MTISSTTNKAQYNGNGVTTSFSFPYIFFAPADLNVTLFDTVAGTNVIPAPVLNGAATYDYTVTGTLDPATGEYLSGGNVVFNTAPIATYRVTIQRVLNFTQLITLIDNNKFPAATVNGALDRLTIFVQQLNQAFSQALLTLDSDTAAIGRLPSSTVRANAFLAFDGSGNPYAALAVSSVAASTYMATTIFPLTSAAAVRTAIAATGLGDTNAWTGANSFAISPTVPTAAAGDNTLKAASTAYVDRKGFLATQIFTGNGTYTPTAGMRYCVAEGVGPGGGGGGTATAAGNQGSSGGGGGGGGYARVTLTAAQIGASKAVVIGAAGAAGASGNNAGSPGSADTTLGATLLVAKLGGGGGGHSGVSNVIATGGAGGVVGTGDVTIPGQPGSSTLAANLVPPTGSKGGDSFFGRGGNNTPTITAATGAAGTGFGGGGAGGTSFNAGGAAAGGAGTIGWMIITEYA